MQVLRTCRLTLGKRMSIRRIHLSGGVLTLNSLSLPYNRTQTTKPFGSAQASTQRRPRSTAETTSQAVPSDQLGFVPDPAPTSPLHDIPIASTDENKISILWSPQNWSRFHHIWLRDHCRCPSCFHPVTKQRLVNTFQIPRDIKPIHVHGSTEGLEVVWPAPTTEHHSSFYPWTWLREHSYDPPHQKDHQVNEKVLWGAKIAKSPPTVTYEEVMDSTDTGLYKWLSDIDRFGICFVSGVPSTPKATEGLCERIGFIRETQYGKFWQFTAGLAKADMAYTTMALGAHTDNTYFTDPCGLQVFHLLSHTDGSGGATLLVDGFYVASLLKELHPDLYDVLSNVPIPAHAAGEPTLIYKPSPPSGYPTLQHDFLTRELTQVRWNNDDRSVMSHLEPDLVERWYDAIRTWHKLLISPDSEFWVQLTPGTVLTVNNHRVLHGRSAFDGKRHVCGAYIGIDEYRSKLTVLREKFDPRFKAPATHETLTSKDSRSVWNPIL